MTKALKRRFGGEESPSVLLAQVDQLDQSGESVKSYSSHFESMWGEYEAVVAS